MVELPKPLGLLAELTHRCPLGCPYCSNPLAMDSRDDELDAGTWSRVFKEAAALGVSFAQVQIRDQRTRWGSCSSRGTLSFNWRLVLAPFDVLDYVVVHEVCHLLQPNHSPRFWRLVGERRPEWRVQRDWLRSYGAELLAFRPAARGE